MVYPNYPSGQPGPPQGYRPVPQGPAPQGPFQPGPFSQQPYPYQQPMMPPPIPPQRSRVPLILGLLGVLAIAAAGVSLLIIAPWSSTDDGPAKPVAQSFTLGDGVSVQVTIPDEWTATTESVNEDTGVVIRTKDDNRPLSQIDESISTLNKRGTGQPVHAIVIVPTKCPQSGAQSDTWTTKESDKSTSSHTEKWLKSFIQVDDQKCVLMSGIDAATDASVAGTLAVDLARSLVNKDLITVGKAI